MRPLRATRRLPELARGTFYLERVEWCGGGRAAYRSSGCFRVDSGWLTPATPRSRLGSRRTDRIWRRTGDREEARQRRLCSGTFTALEDLVPGDAGLGDVFSGIAR